MTSGGFGMKHKTISIHFKMRKARKSDKSAMLCTSTTHCSVRLVYTHSHTLFLWYCFVATATDLYTASLAAPKAIVSAVVYRNGGINSVLWKRMHQKRFINFTTKTWLMITWFEPDFDSRHWKSWFGRYLSKLHKQKCFLLLKLLCRELEKSLKGVKFL